MRILLKIALVGLLVCLACSCSMFGSKPKEAAKPPGNQQQAAAPQAEPTPSGDLAPSVDLTPSPELYRPPPPPEPVVPAVISYKKGGIHINIKSDPRLNLYQGRPHALTLCIYQLKDPNQFVQASERPDGVDSLKRCERFESVANAKMEFVQPGKDQALVRDRAEGARYLGMVAGYNSTDTDKIISLNQIPLKSLAADSNPLSVNLSLGADAILDVKVE